MCQYCPNLHLPLINWSDSYLWSMNLHTINSSFHKLLTCYLNLKLEFKLRILYKLPNPLFNYPGKPKKITRGRQWQVKIWPEVGKNGNEASLVTGHPVDINYHKSDVNYHNLIWCKYEWLIVLFVKIKLLRNYNKICIDLHQLAQKLYNKTQLHNWTIWKRLSQRTST